MLPATRHPPEFALQNPLAVDDVTDARFVVETVCLREARKTIEMREAPKVSHVLPACIYVARRMFVDVCLVEVRRQTAVRTA